MRPDTPEASLDETHPRGGPPPSGLGGLSWLPAGLLLLFGEYLGISYTHDALPLLQRGGWQGALGHVGMLGPLGGVVLTATALAGGRPLFETLRGLLSVRQSVARKIGWLAANLASYGALMWTTGRLLESLGGTADASGLTVAFILSALGTGVAGLFVAVSPDRWLAIVRATKKPLLLGLGAGLVAWIAGLISAELWSELSFYTLETVAALIAPFTDTLVYVPDEAIVGTETFYVVIAPVCSGYEGIGLIAVFVSLYLWVARQTLRFPNAWLLLPLAVLLVWFGNSLRIALLIAVGIRISPEVALGGFHSKAGWLFFCAIALGTVAVAQRWRFVAKGPEVPAPREAEQVDNPTATYLMPLLTLIGTKLLTGLFVGDFDHLYPLSFLTVAAVLFLYRKSLPAFGWSPSWHAPVIGMAVFPLWLLTYPDVDAETGNQLQASVSSLGSPLAAGWILFRVLGSCLTVPIAEELAFRGYLLRRLIDADFTAVSLHRLTPLAVIGSSIAFGALHQAYVGGALAGLAYAIAQWSRGRMGDAIVAHAVTNGLITLDVLARGNWYLWA